MVDNTEVFTHVFDPRIDADGYATGLNYGFIGIGANNSISRIDNLQVQVLPPEITYHGEADWVADSVYFGVDQTTSGWNDVAAGLTAQVGVDGPEISLIDLGMTQDMNINSLITLDLELNAQGQAVVVLDYYSPTDYKFVVVDDANDKIVYGHATERKGVVIDAEVDRIIDGSVEHDLSVSIKGLTISVEIDGQIVTGHAYNGVLVDGGFGLYVGQGAATFSTLIVETDDSYFDGSTVPTATSEASGGDSGNSSTDSTDGTTTEPDSTPVDPEPAPAPSSNGGGKGKKK